MESNPDFIPSLVPTFGIQGSVTAEAASILGLTKGFRFPTVQAINQQRALAQRAEAW